jgi:hypothetical protein
MKQVVFGVFAGLTLLSVQAQAHPVESRVAIEPENEGSFQAGKIHYEFQLVDTKLNQVLSDKNLVVTQEKILHLYIYDPALSEFRHEHPAFNGTVWTVDTDLKINGNYWVWVQGQLGSDQTEFLGSNRIDVQGGTPANPAPPQLVDTRQGADSNSVVTLDATVIHANAMVMLTATIPHKDGTAPSLTNWLGVRAHITTVSDDGDALIHSHPMDMPDPNQFMIHTTFPEAGNYRIWVQFMDGNVLKTVPLSVSVLD